MRKIDRMVEFHKIHDYKPNRVIIYKSKFYISFIYCYMFLCYVKVHKL
jgi:hypothetical protein